MTEIILKLRIVTPLFIGGAEQESEAELREPSIKGLLLFWNRVLYPNDSVSEARIFGGQGKGQGQSRVLLRISNKTLISGAKGDQRWDGTKTAYLGYGVINRGETGEFKTDKNGNRTPVKKVITTRPYIKSGSRFVLTIRFKPVPKDSLDEERKVFQEDEQRVKMAVWAWLMFGGLGARSRKGFGSIIVESAEGMNDLPALKVNNTDDLQRSIQEFIKTIPSMSKLSGYPEHTHWSEKTRCLITGHGKSGEEALENLGCKISSLRSYKSTSRLAWVKNDHDLMSDFIHKRIKLKNPPLRSAFGLPHNYFFSSSNESGEVNFMDENGKKGRRASPVFFTVYEFPTHTKACIVALFLPAKLIPANKAVRISTGEQGKPNYRYEDIALPDDFTAITGVLDELSKSDNHGLKVHP
jgi:CRISPR-associated protein Cmr1